ncbi:MAG: hypothetical protein HOY76_49230, partial [Streptomyces sp.]|nr:hypothetical protein [Streptomyces sp.]
MDGKKVSAAGARGAAPVTSAVPVTPVAPVTPAVQDSPAVQETEAPRSAVSRRRFMVYSLAATTLTVAAPLACDTSSAQGSEPRRDASGVL